MKLPNRRATIAYWSLFALSGSLGVLFGWKFQERTEPWTATQWGPAAAWVAGLLTFGAVSVSLWQALEARKKSAQDSLAAEERSRVEAERHAEQLNAANARLENELNAQRQYQQLQSIPPIWDAIGDLTVPTNNLLQTLQRARVDEDTKSIAKAELLAWRPIAFKAAISFSSAFLLINEENTMASIRKTQSALEMLVKAVERLHSDISAGEPVTARSIGEASKLQNELVANRKEMIETAKQHIGGYNGIPSTQTNPDPGS